MSTRELLDQAKSLQQEIYRLSAIAYPTLQSEISGNSQKPEFARIAKEANEWFLLVPAIEYKVLEMTAREKSMRRVEINKGAYLRWYREKYNSGNDLSGKIFCEAGQETADDVMCHTYGISFSVPRRFIVRMWDE